jgi:hypothetical protein
MLKFVRKSLLLILPFITLLSIYFILDPFKVIRHYSNYYDIDETGRVGINRDYISTSTFINNNKTSRYDSFIFGNSRSIFYEINDWKKYIGEASQCYHFDASGETLYGIYKKLIFLEQNSVSIKNAMIILDYDTLSKTVSNKGHLFIISPQLENYANMLLFQMTFIKAFYNPGFMFAFLDFKTTGNVKEYMTINNYLDDKPLAYDVLSNELSYPIFESQIKEGTYYTNERMRVFFSRVEYAEESPVVIYSTQQELLEKIRNILIKNKTKFKIIINPLYEQKELNKKDMEYLQKLFGEQNVFDFSGINEFTNDYRNYYENSHYRPTVSKEIMKIIYE